MANDPIANESGPLYGPSGPLYTPGANCVGCGCDAVPCYYRFKKCSDSTDSAYWMRVNGAGPDCPTLSRGWVFQTEDGNCYYVSAGQSGTTDDHSADGLPTPNTEIEACNLCPVTFWECFGCPEGCVTTSITFNLTGGGWPQCHPFDGTLQNWHQEFTRNPFEGSFELVRYSSAVDDRCCFRYRKDVEQYARTYWTDDPGSTGCIGTVEDPTVSKIQIDTCGVAGSGQWWVEYPFPTVDGTLNPNPFSMTDYAGSWVSLASNSGCTNPGTIVNHEADTSDPLDEANYSPYGGTTTMTLHLDCDYEPPP